MRAELVPEAGGEPIPITRDITVVGRREFCDVRIDDPSLSKRHCVLVKTDGLLVVRDLATTNGTKVKGQLVRWAALLPDDRLTLGKVRFRVFLGPDGSTSASPPRAKAQPSRPAPEHPPVAVSAGVPVAAHPQRRPDPVLPVPIAREPENLDWLDQLEAVDLADEIIDLE